MIQEQFQHQYFFFFGFHHAITDGQSNVFICKYFIEFLNQIIKGETIDDSELLGAHVSEARTVQEIQKIKEQIQKDPSEIERIKSICNIETDILFLKAFPPPQQVEVRMTYRIYRTVDKSTTGLLLQRCRAEGVTLNSLLTTAINATIIELLLMKGIDQESYELPCLHVTNNRKFWTDYKDHAKAFGCHIGFLTAHISCPRTMKQDLWKHTKIYHDMFLGLMKEKFMFKAPAVKMMNSSANSELYDDDVQKILTAPPIEYFHVTNMGNLDSILPTSGDHVQLTDIKRTVTIFSLCSHAFHSFRGRLQHVMSYNNMWMKKETAELYTNTFIGLLEKSIQ